jgi:hypothetical protein
VFLINKCKLRLCNFAFTDEYKGCVLSRCLYSTHSFPSVCRISARRKETVHHKWCSIWNWLQTCCSCCRFVDSQLLRVYDGWQVNLRLMLKFVEIGTHNDPSERFTNIYKSTLFWHILVKTNTPFHGRVEDETWSKVVHSRDLISISTAEKKYGIMGKGMVKFSLVLNYAPRLAYVWCSWDIAPCILNLATR